tara:strand:- start:1448 stop:2014 length:567 start_codon:yes stop_codon:yes gene_type:complete
MKPKDKPHYVNNRDFSNAVTEYVTIVNEAVEQEKDIPKVTDYIALSFLRIANGLSHKGNFVRYTYREEMVMDGVEHCLKAIKNYNIEAATRTGKPNAFGYFTQICWYAFLQRIAKEKKQQDIKMKYISQTPSFEFADGDTSLVSNVVDQLKSRIESVKEKDKFIAEVVKKKKRQKKVDPDEGLGKFMK